MKRKLDLATLCVQSFLPEPPPGEGDMLYAPSHIDFTMCHTDCNCPATP
jgi:hypothetical protein